MILQDMCVCVCVVGVVSNAITTQEINRRAKVTSRRHGILPIYMRAESVKLRLAHGMWRQSHRIRQT